MVYDSRLTQLRTHFGITTTEDWRDVAPSWITSLPGYGPGILSYIRLELAIKGLTLRDDKTAEFWREHLSTSNVSQPMGDPDDEENVERHRVCPFTILVDSAETQPFTFTGLREDESEGGRPLIVPTEWQCLGRHPNSLGDYAIAGYQGRCQVERKSMDDAHGTILGYGDGRRERFESELSNLSTVVESGGSAVVVVECGFKELLMNSPEWGKKTAAENRKSLFRSVMSFQQKYRVQWAFCEGRRLAEIYTFDFLRMFWRKRREEEKRERKELQGVRNDRITNK